MPEINYTMGAKESIKIWRKLIMPVKNIPQQNLQEILNRGFGEGFRTIAVKECIGDLIPGAVAWNLFDIDAKYADVESVDTCVEYLLSQ